MLVVVIFVVVVVDDDVDEGDRQSKDIMLQVNRRTKTVLRRTNLRVVRNSSCSFYK
jgi:hypothetical protein